MQNVLTAYYEDIKGVVSASCCNKSKVVNQVKCKFEDQDDTGLAPDADATPATPPDGGAEPHPAGKSLLLPSPAAKGGGGRGRGGGGGKKAAGKASG